MDQSREKIECEIKYLFPIDEFKNLEKKIYSLCEPRSIRKLWIMDFRFNIVKNDEGKKSYDRIRKEVEGSNVRYYFGSKKLESVYGSTSEVEVELSEVEAEQIISENLYRLYKKQRISGDIIKHGLHLENPIALALDVLPVIPDRCYIECETELYGDKGIVESEQVKKILDDFIQKNFDISHAERKF